MTVRELVGVLRDQGFLRSVPTLPGGPPDPTADEALGMLEGAYEVLPHFEIVEPSLGA